ncbi:MAG: DUF3849 domain-containing protein, partial [Oscillospiraceae bacterium]|nr:DUF3849 domain-containing protein [Oscillospiraceae bacterium]
MLMPEIEKVTAQDRINEITDKLEKGIKELFEGDKFRNYLNTMSKFHDYSFNNTLLIAMQKPEATLVAGFNAWKNKFSRNVNRGEKGIQIFAPAPYKIRKEQTKIDKDTGLPVLDKNGKPVTEEVEVKIPAFKVVSVFDVSQTSGKELPTLGVDELKGNVQNYEKFFEALKSAAPVPISFEDIKGGAKGYFDKERNTIAINEGMSETQTVKTAIHEIAHSILHNRSLMVSDLDKPKDRNTEEVEAESIAYTVCQHFGIDTSDYSFAYVASWGSGKDVPELKASLETIRATANDIIKKLEDILLGRQKEQVQDKTPNQEKSDAVSLPETTDHSAIPVYLKTIKEARELGELDLFKENESENRYCNTVLSFAVMENYHMSENGYGGIFDADTALKQALEKCPLDRITYLVASRVSANEWDKRFTDNVHKWADNIILPLPESVKEDLRYVQINDHSGLVNMLAEKIMEKQLEIDNTAEKNKETAFLTSDDDMIAIYQLKHTPENHDISFTGLDYLEKMGKVVNRDNYDLVYSYKEDLSGIESMPVFLESIFEKFNMDHPKDFEGHSLSVSDVVAVKKDGKISAHFVDSVGFKELTQFGQI